MTDKYYVFCYSEGYAQGGMDDCTMITDSYSRALGYSMDRAGEGHEYVYIWYVNMDKKIVEFVNGNRVDYM